ncbi:hypothetical protein [Methylobacterium radiotolerans]|uniref:hypothetical protein n=1 Tax=Methylobacterium radiotolerans TaxID=31998 RepID=UPI0015F618F8|nr:hypothetical protein [Methylobacterium radiotolerans]
MQPLTATASVCPPFDAADWIRRARAIDRHLAATTNGFFRSFCTGDDPEEVRREEARLDDELADPEASRAVWAALLEWADR